jgi:hypothetical protein
LRSSLSSASRRLLHYRQGDGKIDIHDWAIEFTAADVLLQFAGGKSGQSKVAIVPPHWSAAGQAHVRQNLPPNCSDCLCRQPGGDCVGVLSVCASLDGG